MTARQSRVRRLLLPVLKISVSAALMALLISRIDISKLWSIARTATVSWLALALAVYLAMVLVSAWRWGVLLKAQQIALRFRTLVSSFLVATFFNNFLPSNIGGDVVRITDTAPAAGSKTLAATIVLIDRGIGLLGLILVAALGATAGPRLVDAGPGVGAPMLWTVFAGALMVAIPAVSMPQVLPRLLRPLRALHQDWVEERLSRLGGALERFKRAPGALIACFGGAVAVQAALVGFYAAIAYSMSIPIGFAELAVLVPISFLVQMAPVSVNGFGVREATFGFYFSRLGLPLESALLVSFVGAALMMAFSLSGAVAYLARRRERTRHPLISETL